VSHEQFNQLGSTNSTIALEVLLLLTTKYTLNRWYQQTFAEQRLSAWDKEKKWKKPIKLRFLAHPNLYKTTKYHNHK